MSPILKAFEELRSLGWYCELGLPCCQSCAWGSIPFEHEYGPFKGEDIDFEKVLFNHEQDMEVWDRDGNDTEDSPIRYCTVEELRHTALCHSGKTKEVKKAVEILEKHGCIVDWNGKADMRLCVDIPNES